MTFREIFQEHGFTVEELGDKGISYIVSNDKFCLPVTEVTKSSVFGPEIDTVTFPAESKNELLHEYSDWLDTIGRMAYRDYQNYRIKVIPRAGLCGEEISLQEVETWLRYIEKIEKGVLK